MANETIVSPGVFTRENDQSFLPQGIGQIGAAIIGPTVQGPAFVPVLIRNGFSEFQRRFGGLSKNTYVPQTVREYLRSAGSVIVCRVLAGGGYKFNGSTKQLAALVTTGSAFSVLTSGHPSNAVTASAGSKVIEAVGATFSTQLKVGDGIRISSASVAFTSTVESIVSNTIVSMSEAFTGTAASSFATASRKTEINEILTVFYPSKNTSNANALELGDSTALSTVTNVSPFSISSSFGLTISGASQTAKNFTASLVTTQNDYIEQVIGLTGNSANSKTGANSYEFTAFPYLNFKSRQKQLADKHLLDIKLGIQESECTFTSSYSEGYNAASTPFITSQFDGSKNTTELFKFHTLADGTDTNKKYKISIANLKEPADIDGVEQYSQFNVLVR